MGVTLRVCPQGRRATGYAIATVLRYATHCSRTLRMPHAAAIELNPLTKILTL
ncbi:MAG: hypothetical protein RML94_15505 [Bacteroidia bacterium]|nr:hypothetical protein [Bacteroidia bacterium]